jgi:hypothetical protein
MAVAARTFAGSAVELTLSAGEPNPAPGEAFTVTVHVADAPPFRGWQAFLAFDPAEVEVTGQQGGSFPCTFFMPDQDPSDGNVGVEAADAGGNAGGDGALAVFTFRAPARGATTITTRNRSASNPTGNVLQNRAHGSFLPDILVGELRITVGSAPVASAGSDQTVGERQTAVLDGSGSFSPDAGVGIPGYLWEQISGPPVTLCGANTAVATFVAPSGAAPEDIVCRLTVTDDDGLAGTDTVAVTVEAVSKADPGTDTESELRNRRRPRGRRFLDFTRFVPCIWPRCGLPYRIPRRWAYEQVVWLSHWRWPGKATGLRRGAPGNSRDGGGGPTPAAGCPQSEIQKSRLESSEGRNGGSR